MTITELIAAIQEAAAGKKMQAAYSPLGGWVEFDAEKWIADLLFHNPNMLRVAPKPRERWYPDFPDEDALGLLGEPTAASCLRRWPGCKPVLFREVMEC